MENQYHITYEKSMNKDLEKIRRFMRNKMNYKKDIEKINNDIENLKYMPRIHKTLLSSKDPKGEYRGMIPGKYIIIYQVEKEKINILRVFSEKQNYLNQKNLF